MRTTLTNLRSNTFFKNHEGKINALARHLTPAIGIEAAYYVSWSTVALQFIPKEELTWWNNPYMYSAAAVTINTALYKLNSVVNNIIPSTEKNKVLLACQFILNCGPSFVFGLSQEMLVDDAVHELGHALVGYNCYNNPNITITINWRKFLSDGAVTRYDSSELSSSCQNLGLLNTQRLSNFAGTGMSMTWCLMSMIFAQTLTDDKFSRLKSHIRLSVLVTMLSNFMYALSPYLDGCDKDKGNDFCHLQEHGISPGMVTGLMLGAIIGLQIILSSINKCCTSKQSNKPNKSHRIVELDEENETVYKEDSDDIEFDNSNYTPNEIYNCDSKTDEEEQSLIPMKKSKV